MDGGGGDEGRLQGGGGVTSGGGVTKTGGMRVSPRLEGRLGIYQGYSVGKAYQGGYGGPHLRGEVLDGSNG